MKDIIKLLENNKAWARQVEIESQRKQALLKDVRGRKAKASEVVKGLELSAGRLQGCMALLDREACGEQGRGRVLWAAECRAVGSANSRDRALR